MVTRAPSAAQPGFNLGAAWFQTLASSPPPPRPPALRCFTENTQAPRPVIPVEKGAPTSSPLPEGMDAGCPFLDIELGRGWHPFSGPQPPPL